MKISEFNFGEYDARREFLRSQRFFLETFIDPISFPLSTISNDKNYIIIGQKGAGKTACQLYLETEKADKEGYISDLISFYDDISPDDYKDFASTQKINLLSVDDLDKLELLYDFREVWKRIFLVRIAKVLKASGFSNLFIDFCLSSINGTNSIIDGIKRSLKIEIKIPLALLETKVKFDPSKLKDGNEITLTEFNRLALSLLASECKQYRLYFFVDELIISTLNTRSDEYKARICLIRDIVRVCCLMNDFCVKNNLDIHFVCNLRPEIRTRLNDYDPEISKIMDGNDVFLAWDQESLSEILLQKIVNGAPPLDEPLDADKFLPQTITFGAHTQDFMTFLMNNTWFKPRDIVRFLKVYAKCNPNDRCISEEGVKGCLNEYARISAVELFEQISVRHAPETIAGIKAGIKKRRYQNTKELIGELGPKVHHTDLHFLARELYEVGVIGNLDTVGGRPRYFWAHRQEEQLDDGMEIIVHPGLLNFFNVRHR